MRASRFVQLSAPILYLMLSACSTRSDDDSEDPADAAGFAGDKLTGVLVNGMVPTGDGGWSLTGFSLHNPLAGFWVGRIDATGQLAWQRELTVTDDAIGYGIATTPDQGVIAVALQERTGTSAGWIFALDAAGGTRWQRTLTSASERVLLRGVRVAGDAVFVLGEVGSVEDQDLVVMKLALDGTPQWSRRVDSGQYDTASQILVVDGRLLLVGATGPRNMAADIWVLVLDQEGALVTQHTYGRMVEGGAAAFDTHAVLATIGDGYALAINSNPTGGSGGGSRTLVLRLDADWNVEWHRLLDGFVNTPASIAVDANDTIWINGGVFSAERLYDGFLASITSGGELVSLDAIGGNDWDGAMQLSTNVLVAHGDLVTGAYYSESSGSHGTLLVSIPPATPAVASCSLRHADRTLTLQPFTLSTGAVAEPHSAPATLTIDDQPVSPVEAAASIVAVCGS